MFVAIMLSCLITAPVNQCMKTARQFSTMAACQEAAMALTVELATQESRNIRVRCFPVPVADDPAQ